VSRRLSILLARFPAFDRLVCISGLLLMCAGCANQTITQSAPRSPTPQSLMPALENRIYELVEQERGKGISRSLMLDSELTGVARERSADMAAHRYAAHASAEGETSTTLIMKEDSGFHGLLGENIAAQPFLPQYAIDVESCARHVVDIWLASRAHRENLMDSAYGRTGIGAAASADMVYVTELFSGPLDAQQKAPH
jgi:uncharacterized protein YkwD